jgi:hypothetical protein
MKECIIYSDEEIKNFNINKCDVCRTLDNLQVSKEERDKISSQIKCCFCYKNDGILKKFKEKKDKWTHVNCMKWFINIRLYYENGFSIFKSDKPMPEYIWMEECSMCRKTVKGDFFIKCGKQACNKYFHSRCVNNKSMLDVIKGVDNRINYYIYHCDEHSNIFLSDNLYRKFEEEFECVIGY